MYGRITRTTPEHLGQGDRTYGDSGTPSEGGLQVGTCTAVTSSELGQAFTIEDQGPAHGYSSSGHAARASLR